MPETAFVKKNVDTPLFRYFPRFVGCAVALFGLLIVASWFAHWRPILQMLPNTAPMQFNTAVCFILSGAGLFLLTTRRPDYAPWLGGAAALFALLTLLEYLTSRDFSIDQIFFKPYFQADTVYPGRMSPLAAVCFIFIGSGIVLSSLKKQWPHRLTAAGILACIIVIIALVALFGFTFGIESAYGWGSYSRMAINTAIAFLLLGTGLLVRSWQAARREKFNFLRWLPVTGSVTLMVMVAFVSAVNMAELRNAIFWRKHTFQMILNAQTFQDNLIALQLGVRGYVTLDDTNALASYQNSLKLEPQQFNQLVKLISDNPTQRRNLKSLSLAMDEVFSYDERVIALYKQQGSAAVSKMDAKGESRTVFSNAHDVLKVFSQEEQRLLDVRNASEHADYQNAERLLVLGSVLAALLLVVANQMASRELHHRQRAEARLQQTLLLQKAILNSAGYGIVSTDPKGIVLTFNSTAERWLGYAAAEIIGKVTPALWHDAAEVVARAKVLSRELKYTVEPGFESFAAKPRLGQIDENEWTLTRKDGSRFPAMLSATALMDEVGVITGFLGVIADITERKRAEESLHESEERFKNLSAAAFEGICISEKGRVLDVNSQFLTMFGYERNEVIGHQIAVGKVNGFVTGFLGEQILPAAPISRPSAALLGDDDAFAGHKNRAAADLRKILVERVEATDVHSAGQLAEPVLKVRFGVPRSSFIKIIEAGGGGGIGGVNYRIDDGHTTFWTGGYWHPDHAGSERAIRQPQRQRGIENEVRIHELARAPAGSEFVWVAVERINLADQHAQIFGKELGVVEVGDGEGNILVEF
jgi:PAS domain S-box-containing protein